MGKRSNGAEMLAACLGAVRERVPQVQLESRLDTAQGLNTFRTQSQINLAGQVCSPPPPG